jgi:hypothetical protein
MKRLLIKMKWLLQGSPACVTRKRIRTQIEQEAADAIATGWYFDGRRV